MPYENFECLRIRCDRGVAFVTIDHPPINLLDMALIMDLDRVGRELEADGGIRAVVFESADTDFFIAHADVELIRQMPKEPPPKAETLGLFHQMVDRFRTMPKATIGKIEGIARGGGSEFLLSLDMRFGALGKCVLAQPEVALGIIPGGSGTLRLPRLLGRGRALEIVLGCQDYPAELAEKYGYINRALPAAEIAAFVEALAYRIASFPADAFRLAKASVDAAELPTVAGLIEEAHFFNLSLATKGAQERMAAFMAAGGQTREVESADLGKALETVGGG
jgi:enoyl-CoA hydratase/carnithine racemase